MFWKKQQVSNFGALLQCVPNQALNSPRRSIVPLLDFWRVPATASARIAQITESQLNDATDLRFEYAVPVHTARGKSSFTDLVILTPGKVVAVEADYGEPKYESVQSWLSKGNRQQVLKGWLDLLNRVTARPVVIDDVQSLPYQWVHRLACTCYTERDHRLILYLRFERASSQFDAHVNDITPLLSRGFSVYHATCVLTKSPQFVALEQRWDSGERHMANPIRAALAEQPLFAFGDWSQSKLL